MLRQLEVLILGTFLELGLPARLWPRWAMMPLKKGRHHHPGYQLCRRVALTHNAYLTGCTNSASTNV